VSGSKVAVLAIRQFSRQTGAVRHAMEQVACLQAMGFRVLVLAERGSSDALAESGCGWIRIPRWPIKGLQRRLAFDWMTQRHYRRLQPALFISHGDARSDDLLFMHNCLHLEAERVPEGAGSMPSDALRFHERVLNESRFRYLVANSQLMKDDLVQRFGLDADRVRVFHQGVDNRAFSPAAGPVLRELGRSRLGIPTGRQVLGLVTSGNFGKRNVDLFLQTAALVHREVPRTHFLIAGKDSRLARYQQQVNRLGLGDAVTFAVPIAEVAQYYHSIDLMLYPAWIEEYGRVVLEALACGVPAMVSSAVGASEVMAAEGVPEILQGWDANAWAKCALDVLNDPGRQLAMRVAGLALAARYSRERRLYALQQLLEETARPISC
jgi:UDP-glucose:(heptosyl)LPS alpha-1,3-glucosyltransferase